jgi:hypothetical protein
MVKEIPHKIKQELETVPRKYRTKLVEDYKRIREKNERAAEIFLGGALKMLEKAPILYSDYKETGLKILEKDREIAAYFFEHAPYVLVQTSQEYRTLVLQATKKLADHDATFAYDFFLGIPPFPNIVQPCKNADELLIESIHDLKSAQIISQVIDLQKYGKQYAEKVGRFY